MNILFLLSNFQDGGIETVATEYMNNLVRLTEHKVTLGIALNLGEYEVFLDRLDKRIDVVHFVNSPLLTFRKKYNHRHKKNALLSFADEVFLNPVRRFMLNRGIKQIAHNYDVVIDFDYQQEPYISHFSSARKIAYYHFSLKKNLKSERDKTRFVRKAHKYDNIVLLCDSMLAEAKQMFPEIALKFVRIYNSINPEYLTKRASEPIPDCFSPLTDAPYLVAVERLAETQKDISTLVATFGLYIKAHPESTLKRLLIIGEGESRALLEKLIMDLSLQDHVHLLGFVANPYPFIWKAEALVHSAKFEGLPTVLIEALLLDRIIISTDCPVGPREVLADGKHGVLVPVGDAEAFATAIHETLTNAEIKNRLCKGRDEHKTKFMPCACLNDLQALFV